MKSQNFEVLKWDIFTNTRLQTGITTRLGGVSRPPYSSLNLAGHTGDNLTDVNSNREILCNHLSTCKEMYTHGIQVHGDKIHRVTEDNIGDNSNECDALLTTSDKPLLNIFVADCVPIVIYDREKNIGALCHCGWKGTFKTLLKKMIYEFIDDFNSYRSDILIGIGPSIGSCCYNVSSDLFNSFNPVAKEGFKKDSEFFLDLKEINKNQALNAGIPLENIEIMDMCTSCNNMFKIIAIFAYTHLSSFF